MHFYPRLVSSPVECDGEQSDGTRRDHKKKPAQMLAPKSLEAELNLIHIRVSLAESLERLPKHRKNGALSLRALRDFAKGARTKNRSSPTNRGGKDQRVA